MGKAEQSESKAKAAEDAKTPSSCTRAGDNHGPMSLIRPYKADGAFLGPSWPISSSFGSLFGLSWGHLGPCKGILGHLGAILEPSWAILGHLGTILRKRSVRLLGPLRAFAKMEASCSRNPIFCNTKQRFYNPLPPHKRGPNEAILRIKREW